MIALDVFLTAYDPSDLPGGSIDPLGFERGYLHLADKILPGMTNVANCPRYFGVLCAGSALSGVENDEPPRVQRERRREHILRFERLWALANVLAARARDREDLSGLRGVTYAARHADRLSEAGRTSTDCGFKLLIRQVPYGALGIYGAVAENCKLLYRKTYELTPGLGEPLAEAFLSETHVPPQVRKVTREKGEVPLSILREWGERAYLWAQTGRDERRCIGEILHSHSIRSRFVTLLQQYPFLEEETELHRLGRIAEAIGKQESSLDLWESVEGILRYETCYRLAQLVMERLLYLCRFRTDPTATLKVTELDSDEVLRTACKRLPSAVSALQQTIDGAVSEHFRTDLSPLGDVCQFLAAAADACEKGSRLAELVLSRHADVQHGKFDRGKRKMPWIQSVEGSLSLTMTRVGGLSREATKPDDIVPHPYRLAAADNWSRAAEGA